MPTPDDETTSLGKDPSGTADQADGSTAEPTDADETRTLSDPGTADRSQPPAGDEADDRPNETAADAHGSEPQSDSVSAWRTPTNRANSSWVLLGRDIATSLLLVALVGAYLFAVSGVWPPMVAVESGSMDPNMEKNDLVFVMDTDRFQPDAAIDGTGVVVARDAAGTGYTQFNNPGDVIVFEPNGNEETTPIIHRAMFFVESGDNWVARANSAFLSSGVDSCSDVRSCPAPHDGFITKGDNNAVYDQTSGGQRSQPVRPDWVVGTAEIRIPGAGWLRLQFG
ncbi:MAG: signal peptidase I [halophilic archaeon J07HX5]|jgi:Signal peptidase I|nr:MAG: signal peptidase I [halophilic archaeon J07HX5]